MKSVKLFFTLVATLLMAGQVWGQVVNGIVVTTPAPDPKIGYFCSGAIISVSFTRVGSTPAAKDNVYKVQMSDKDGNNFRDIPTSGTGSPLTATLQDGNFLSDKYKVRVVGSNPALTGTSDAFTVSRPSGPGATGFGQANTSTLNYCLGQTGIPPLSAVATNGASASGFVWYNPGGAAITKGAVGPTPTTTSTDPQYYQVSQNVNNCESVWSRINISVTVCGPAAPTNLAANAVSTSQINLTWTDNATNETGFQLERSLDGSTNWSLLASPGANATSYTDNNLNSGVRYYYRIRAVNTSGNSAYSNVANAITQSFFVTTGNISDVCIGTNVTVPFTTNVTSLSPLSYLVQLLNTNDQVVQTLSSGSTGSSPFTLLMPASVTPGTYKIRVNSNYPAVTGSVSNAFTVKTTPTLTIINTAPTIVQGDAAPIKITFTGTPSYQFTYNDLKNGLQNLTFTAANVQQDTYIYINPTADYVFDPAKITNFRDNGGCGNNGGGSVSGATTVKVTIPVRISAPTITPSSLPGGFYCPGSQIQVAFTLTGGAASAGNTYKVQMTDKDGNNFRDIPTSGTGSPLTATLQDGNLLSDKYKVRVIVSNPALTSDPSAAFNINRAGGPGVQDVPYCAGQQPTPLGASASNGASASSFKWYDPDGKQLTTGATGPTPAASGNQVFQVGQDVNGCQSTWSRINVTFKGKSGNPQPANSEACQFEAPVTLSASGKNLLWFDANGTPQNGAPTLQTTNTGVQTYQVSQDDNGCRSDRVNVTLTVKARPAKPTAITPAPVCQYTANLPALAATPAAGGALRWYSQATGSAGQSDQAPRPDAQNAGSQTFFVGQIVNGCESSDRDAVTQVIKPASANPAVTQPVLLCRGVAVGPITTAATGEGLRWYDSNNGLLPNNGAAPTPPVGSTATILYRVSQTQTANGCESQKVDVNVNVRNAPDAPVVAPVGLCQNQTLATSLSASVTGTNLSWYATQTGGTSQPTPFVPSTATTGPQTFYVTQSIGTGQGVCEGPRAALTVTVFAVPAAPVITTPPALCQNVVTTNQSVVAAVATGTTAPKWYETATSPASSAAPATPTTAQPGVQSYFVTQTVNNCESSRAKIDLTINPAPVLPTAPAAPDLLRCQVDAARPVSATGAPGNTLRWYGTASGNALPNPTTGQLTAPSPPATVGVYTYYVTQTDANGCQSLQQPVSATVAATPLAPGVTAAQFACLNDAAKALTAQGVTGTTFAWNGPGITPDSPAPPTPPTGAATTLTYTVVQKLGNCTSPASSIAYTVRPLPGAPVVSSNTGPGIQAACIGQPLTLQATGASGNTVRWYKTATGTDQPQNNPLTLPTTAPGNSTYYTTQTDGNGCQSPATPLDVRVRTQAAATLTGDGTVIGFDSTAIRVRLSGDGPYTINLPAVGTTAARTVVILQNPYIWWVTPSFTLPGTTTASNGVITRSSTYSVSVANDCGAGQAVAPYTLIVQTPLATNGLGAEPIALKAYPNPTSGLITVMWVAPDRQAIRLEIVSVQGRAVWQTERTGTGNWQTETLSLGQYPAGQYVLRVTDGGTGTARLRVVKE